MKLVDILIKEAVKTDLQASDKKGVIEELSELMVRAAGLTDSDKKGLTEVLLEREALCTTGIGLNIAIPHARLKGVKGLIAVVARSKNGVNFDALDGKPVNLFFLLVSGVNTEGTHLKALAKISSLLRNAETREALISCDCKVEMYEIISREESKSG
ncbi:MAG: PTS sugar transporter subunit IIA [bacterium]|nr:PTS sugar transporter subunit IIA [bacterium]